MVKFELHDPLHVRIDTENWDYLRAVKEHFSHYVEGYKFMPHYKTGNWDGRISLLNGADRTIPFGLVLDLVKFHKREWSELPYTISNEVKSLFQGITPNYNKDLLFEPYDYQDDCISTCLKTSKGIIRSATASGKSLMISYVQRALFNQCKIKNGIIIVPSIGLVTQFYEDMQDYGINMGMVGRVGEDWREWDNPLVISTWQSLNNVPEHIHRMESVIVDECLDGMTHIRMEKGYKFLKDLKVGDVIMSYDTASNKYELDVVERVYENMMVSSDEKMYELVFDNGERLNVTGNHKILTDKGYVRADELTEQHDIISF